MIKFFCKVGKAGLFAHRISQMLKVGVQRNHLHTLRLLISKLLLISMFIILGCFFYRELTAGRTDTQLKIDNFFIYYQSMGKIVYVKKENKQVKLKQLIGGDYHRLCVLKLRLSIEDIEQALGRKLGIVEKVYIIWMMNTGGENVFGNQFLFEKNNRITLVESVKHSINFSDTNDSKLASCFNYETVTIQNNIPTTTLFIQ